MKSKFIFLSIFLFSAGLPVNGGDLTKKTIPLSPFKHQAKIVFKKKKNVQEPKTFFDLLSVIAYPSLKKNNEAIPQNTDNFLSFLFNEQGHQELNDKLPLEVELSPQEKNNILSSSLPPQINKGDEKKEGLEEEKLPILSYQQKIDFQDSFEGSSLLTAKSQEELVGGIVSQEKDLPSDTFIQPQIKSEADEGKDEKNLILPSSISKAQNPHEQDSEGSLQENHNKNLYLNIDFRDSFEGSTLLTVKNQEEFDGRIVSQEKGLPSDTFIQPQVKSEFDEGKDEKNLILPSPGNKVQNPHEQVFKDSLQENHNKNLYLNPGIYEQEENLFLKELPFYEESFIGEDSKASTSHKSLQARKGRHSSLEMRQKEFEGWEDFEGILSFDLYNSGKKQDLEEKDKKYKPNQQSVFYEDWEGLSQELFPLDKHNKDLNKKIFNESEEIEDYIENQTISYADLHSGFYNIYYEEIEEPSHFPLSYYEEFEEPEFEELEGPLLFSPFYLAKEKNEEDYEKNHIQYKNPQQFSSDEEWAYEF